MISSVRYKLYIETYIQLRSRVLIIPAPSKGKRATFSFDLTQVRSSGGVCNPRRFLVGQPSQVYTMGIIPCWITSFPPTKKINK